MGKYCMLVCLFVCSVVIFVLFILSLEHIFQITYFNCRSSVYSIGDSGAILVLAPTLYATTQL